MPSKVTMWIFPFQSSNYYFTSCLSWPLLWILLFVFLWKIFSLYFWDFYFLFLWLLIFQHVSSAATFKNPSICLPFFHNFTLQNDYHIEICSIYSLFSIDYMTKLWLLENSALKYLRNGQWSSCVWQDKYVHLKNNFQAQLYS